MKKHFNGAVRKATATDLNNIMTIENDCFTDEAYDAHYMGMYLKDSLIGEETQFNIAFNDAAKDTRPAGYSLCSMERNKVGHIVSIAVHHDFQGQGLGRILLDEACDRMKKAGAQNFKLEVAVENEAAIHLYETSGFQKKTALIKNYYGPGRHAHTMIKNVG